MPSKIVLPSGEKTELLLFVAQRLRAEQAPLPEPRDFSDEQLRAWQFSDWQVSPDHHEPEEAEEEEEL